MLPEPYARSRDKPSFCLAVTTATLALSDASGGLISTLLTTQVGVRGESREAITKPLCALDALAIDTSTLWVAFSRPVVNGCPLGLAKQPPWRRGVPRLQCLQGHRCSRASPALTVWAAASDAAFVTRKHPQPLGEIWLCQSKTEMGHSLNINPVDPLSSTRDSVPCLLLLGTGDHCSASATSTPDHTRASRHTQLKGWNSSFCWTSGLTHINYSTLSSRITESFISYLSKTTYQPTAFRLQSLPSAKVEPSHVKNMNNSSPSLLSHADGCSSSDGGLNFRGSRNNSIYPTAVDSQRKFHRV